MKERIMEAIFDSWCDGECGSRKDELLEVQKTIDKLSSYFNAHKNEQIYIETAIMEVICLYERNAFMEGFHVCLELISEFTNIF